MTLRKTTSLTALLSFFLLLITSIILYVTPRGKVASWADWKMLGLEKQQWEALHTNLGLLFIIAGIILTLLNWKPIVEALKNKTKQIRVFTADFNISLLFIIFIVIFTLLELPPVSGIQGFGHKLKDSTAEKYGEPPYDHAESSTLKSFCNRTGLDLRDSIKKLEQADLMGVTDNATLAEIAKTNGMTPQQVYKIIKPEPEADEGMPMKPRMGFGWKKISDVCESYGLDVQTILNRLKEIGIDAKADMSLKDIAEANDMEPISVFQAIRQVQETLD